MNFRTHSQLKNSIKSRLVNHKSFYKHCLNLHKLGMYSKLDIEVQAEILKELENELNRFNSRVK